MLVTIPHIEKHAHPKLIRDRDAKQFLHSSSGREKLVGFTGDLAIQPYSIDSDFGFIPPKPWHPVDHNGGIKEEKYEYQRSNVGKHHSIDYDYAHKQPHAKIRLERQIDKICRYQYKKKHLQSYKEIPSEVRKALMGIEEKPSTQPDISSPYFAIRSWLLETAPDPELKKWIQETKPDSDVRWMLLQEEALHRASQTIMPDPELKRWSKKEKAELDRRIEAKAKLKRREDTNDMIKRDEIAREEQRIQSFQQQAAKRQAIVAPPRSTKDGRIDNMMNVSKNGRRHSPIMYFDAQGIVSLQTQAATSSCKSLNKIDVTDTLYRKRDSINVALASSGKDMEFNARRRESISPSPLTDTASRGRIRPQTAGAKLQTERPVLLRANDVKVDDFKTSMATAAAASHIAGNSNDDTDVDDDDSINTGGKPCTVRRSSPTHRERSLADRLPVYHLPTVHVMTPVSTSNNILTKGHMSESKSQQSHINDPTSLRQRPKTAGAALPTGSHRGKRSTSRPRSASPVNLPVQTLLVNANDRMIGTSTRAQDTINKVQVTLQERPNTAGARLTSQLTNGYEYSLPIVTYVSSIGERNKTSYQLPAQTKKAYTEMKVPRPASAPSVVAVHDYDGHKNHPYTSKGDDRRPHSALYRNALRSTSPKVDPKVKELQQLQQMFGKDLIYRLDSVFAPKQPGNQRTKIKAKLTSWRI